MYVYDFTDGPVCAFSVRIAVARQADRIQPLLWVAELLSSLVVIAVSKPDHL